MRAYRLDRTYGPLVIAWLMAAVLGGGASCSFDAGLTDLACQREGATRDGEVCRDGYWRIRETNDLDAQSTPGDGSAQSDPVSPRPSDATEADARDANDDPADACPAEAACPPTCEATNGGIETCDGLDNDCDGRVDGPTATGSRLFYRDADGDGAGNAAKSRRACTAPAGYVRGASDCNDADADVHPGADEVCDGSVDDNCDGQIDEGCPCTNGQSRRCGVDTGTCTAGAQQCAAGHWLPTCRGEVEPSLDICDGLDNDCDAAVDEDFPRVGSRCTIGRGQCEATGQWICSSDHSHTICNAAAGQPTGETCDGRDNDCDGAVDEDFAPRGVQCAVGRGACQAQGVTVCSADHTATVCGATPGSAHPEICDDGIDNDCDGHIDNGCGPCNYDGASIGVCSNGAIGPDGDCQPPPTYEATETTCDGRDNDCNGFVDEGMLRYTYPDADGDGYGKSSQGALRCPNLSGYVGQNGDCDDGDPLTHPGAPELCDNKDTDCNGNNQDDRGARANDWCARHFDPNSSLKCDDDGPGGTLCCDYDGDAPATYDCDFESVCDNGVDDDGDGNADCADLDCDGLSCATGKTCRAQSCQDI